MKNKRANRPCTKMSGCRAFSCDDDLCRAKKFKRHDVKRIGNEHHKFYNTKVWAAIRDVQLSQYPLCERCIGMDVVTPAVVVDHIIPFRTADDAGWKLFVSRSNHQSLCKACHDSEKHKGEVKGIFHNWTDSRHKQT
ncbi:HNH endonuclease signature motif containing protein [Neptunicoccus sediminis]|uniref:HNH endonuclease n=1 Tax=Neptunicoccus sediminis TaxID=1892596 RepID=UPI0009F31D85